MTDLSDLGSSAFWRVNPKDSDPLETREWLDAFDALVAAEGRERATFILRKLFEHARARRVPMPPVMSTGIAAVWGVLLSRRSVWSPSRRGIRSSQRMRSGFWARAIAQPISPSAAARTLKPLSRRISVRTWETS